MGRVDSTSWYKVEHYRTSITVARPSHKVIVQHVLYIVCLCIPSYQKALLFLLVMVYCTEA